MGRTIEIDPVTRIEGHAKVHIELDDSNQVESAYFHVMEFRGFERFVEGMQVELMPTITTRICGTCPHAHHLVAAKALDNVFSVTPPRAGLLLRQLLNAGSIIHSHAIHFFVLAAPDLMLPADTPPAKRNILGLIEAAPELAKKMLRLRTLGQKITEAVGGRGTHPVTAVAGGMAIGLNPAMLEKLRARADEALDLTRLAVAEGKKALAANQERLSLLHQPMHNLGTLQGSMLDLYDGELLARRPDGSDAGRFTADNYRTHLFEEALPTTYSKQVLYRDADAGPSSYRVGPLARLNCADAIGTPEAADELGQFKEKFGAPCHYTVMNHYARLIELLYCAERAVALLADPDIGSPETQAAISATPRPAAAHVEAPRGVLIHDYQVDANGIIQAANFIVATQHNTWAINGSIKAAAEKLLDQGDQALLDGVEFAIRCYDPCLSCSTHQIGKMPLALEITRGGRTIRQVRR